MRLSKLVQPLPDAVLANYADRSIQGLALNSMRVRPDFLFAMVPGPHGDGSAYVPDAIARGAVAVLAPRQVPVPPHVTLAIVPDVRRALADLCCRYYGSPADHVRTVGVTGTNGKTTTVMLVRALLTTAGKQAALLSTVVNHIGPLQVPAANTTPESPELQALFADMVERHIGYAVMEVSSQGLAQERVRGVPFAVGAYTNITPNEHLDYHGTFENYRAAKAKLFASLAPDATAVLNADDPHCAFLREQRGAGRVLTYGLQAPADVTAEIETMDLAGCTFRLHSPQGRLRLRSPLIGGYNVQNLLCGISCGLALGLDLEGIAEAVRRFPGAPGRLERIDEGQPFTMLVDYAHNNGGLESVLSTLKPLVTAPGRLIVVFGCGGDRDKTKRPLMGATASEHADVIVITADNSRGECTDAILSAIRSGVQAGAECIVEPCRREAIRTAITLARPGDLVALCGKGHEDYQELAGVRYPFDDREVARRALCFHQHRVRDYSQAELSPSGVS